MYDDINNNEQENMNHYDTGSTYTHYDSSEAMNQGSAPKKRKKGGFGRTVAKCLVLALVFGSVSSAAFMGVNYVGNQYLGNSVKSQVSLSKAGNNLTTTTTASSASDVYDVSDIVANCMPSVVSITNVGTQEFQTIFGNYEQDTQSSGSGIIIGKNDTELLIVTNNHVVEDSKELTVTFIDNSQVSAAIKGTDSETDLAVIAIPLKDIPSDTMSQIKVATLGDSDALKVGQGVIAIGNALGYGQSVTVGYVSALNREVKAEDQTSRTLLQTDAAINPGNSGGALLNMKGEVIGINAAKYSSTEVEGMGYAIPISQAQDIINELMNKKTRVAVDEADQGYLGIQGQNIDETAASMYGMPRGIYVYKIVEDSAASKSDLREKDIITKFDGQTVRTMADLKDMLTYYKGGDTVNLTVQSLENGQYVERTVQITLGTKPAGETN